MEQENNREGITLIPNVMRLTRPFLIFTDIFTSALSWWISWNVITVQQNQWELFKISSVALPTIWLIQTLIANYTGLYRAILRYASFHFAITIIKSISLSCLVSFLILKIVFSFLSWQFFLINGLLTLSFVGLTRYFPRFYSELTQKESGAERRVLIYGAGDVGDAVARSILKDKLGAYQIVGFIDDDVKKNGFKVHNIPILGDKNKLEYLIKKYKVDELIVSMSNYSAEALRTLVKECRIHHVFCRMAPTIPDMMSHDIHLKNIDIVDLLKRNPEDLDEKQISRFLNNKKVLISGAAGSIGSELVRQVLRFNPIRLLLVDNSELGLYTLNEELGKQHLVDKNPHLIRLVLMDLCDERAVTKLIAEEKPDLILHAAAYKHVPMLEINPSFGTINNIQGTINIANAANQYHVEKFVMISTDKAVRPTNVMGATKRVCELYIQNLNLHSGTEFVAVRFGNVLGSSGSVIPKFLEQIKNGGPITVTHPDVVRYFMLIQESVQLTLQAASIGHGGEIFILNMGKPVQIREMAEDLIFLAGKEPYRDIDIKFIGLRPGEKLFEELLIDEAEKKTQYENITIGKMTFIDWNELNLKINYLLEIARTTNRENLLAALKSIVPEFNHIDLPVERTGSNVVVLPHRH
jgi:FlaA1/EpsC-like NDP-sugar epimerase